MSNKNKTKQKPPCFQFAYFSHIQVVCLDFFFGFTTSLCFLWYSATFWLLTWQSQSSILHDLLTLLQTSQHTSVYPLHNLKEHTCWTLIQETLVWVRGVRMCLCGKGKVENHWRRGDSSFSWPLSASEHWLNYAGKVSACSDAPLHFCILLQKHTGRWTGKRECFLCPLRN